ncbi:MAG: glycosyltransferase family 4 protein [Candidatus Micrarchaeota archaeon]|nr:glycosyltransferase family 4 protein [Candidatus Micrarchaeota archaeon]
MKIALLSWESLHSIPVGGLGVHVTELAAALERQGNDVHVFTRMGAGQSNYEKIQGVHYHRCPFEFNPNFITEMKNMSNSLAHHLFGVERMIGPFDIVHGHDWHVVEALAAIKNSARRKTLWTCHSTEYGRNGNKFYGGQSNDIRNIEFYGTYVADSVIACSYSMRGEVQWLYRVPDWKLQVIRNGIQADKYLGKLDAGDVKKKYGLGPIDPTILYVGRMAYQKGPDLMLESIPYVLRSHPTARAIFVGDGHLKRHLEWRAWNLGISYATRFPGYIPDGDVLDLYKACETVCVPSRNEPFGLVVLEAMASGKPVVVTHGGGPEEIVQHEVTGVKVYPNPGSIAWGLDYILSDFDRAKSMGKNGKKLAQTVYSWDCVADETLELYQKILKQ